MSLYLDVFLKFKEIKGIMLTFKNSARHDVGGYCVIFMTGRKLR